MTPEIDVMTALKHRRSGCRILIAQAAHVAKEVRSGGTHLNLRHYLYVSDSKVDMLLAQIDPSFIRKQTTEYMADAKLAGIRRTTENTQNSDRIVRLERVIRHLKKHGDLGTADAPRTFVFQERLNMRWDLLRDSDGASLTYFGGRTDSGVVVGLGGSTHHLLGASPDSGGAPALPRSLLPSLLNGLRVDPEIDSLFTGDGPGSRGTPEAAALTAVCQSVAALRKPLQTMEFIATPLLHGPSPRPECGSTVLLGSPLYVAQISQIF
ncbi:DUF7019 family protein [Streptomyces sp. NPDC055059]|uniref:DUF7019 family protein n=1 Tax=Streptomyces sp. NPDC127172 TaxID=3345382 RepID=UPI003638B561